MSEKIVHDQSIPEAGQLVEARRRQWIVSDVEKSTLSNAVNTKPQHLIKLSSVDEDALGEELNVIWEIEPGVRKLENAGLPKFSGYDDPEKIDAFLDAVRWGSATNADRGFLQAPFRSGITIEDYQLDPLVRAIDMARVNLLIADDVGLGKTIEAGLIIQELIVRHRARSVLVICPADLQFKWQNEMQEKFGLEFKIVDTDYVKALRRERGIHANPWTSFPRLIASMDWMKAGDPLRLIKDILPPHTTYPRRFDILVIDEAHNVAPSMASKYAVESQRTRLVRTIAPHFEHKLFLTATPHNGYLESFTSLLELLDDQRFARTVEPDEKQLQKILVRRLKTDLVDINGKPIYLKRELQSLNVEYTKEEIEIHALLNRFTKSRVESAKTHGYEFGLEFMHKLLKKRLFSSPSAFAVSISRHRNSIISPKIEKSKADRLDSLVLRKALLEAEENYANDAELENALDESIEEVSRLPVPLSKDESIMLGQLMDWAEASANRPDSKATAILKWLSEYVKVKGNWTDNRVILFTEYRPTQSWLHQIFASHGVESDRIAILNGDTPFEEREKIKAAFQAKPSESLLRILIATDAASEGIDLQNYCNFLIHIEIPWNPNVMEQRNGRIDRHGQKKTPYIWHPVGSKNESSKDELLSDDEFLMKAVIKVNAIREDLGSVGPVIAHQIEQAMLGRRKTLDTEQAESKAAKAKKYMTLEKELKKKIERLHGRVMETKKDFHLTPERVASAVKTALSIAELPNIKEIGSSDLYEVPILPGAWGRSLKGLEHPHTGFRRPVTFDQESAKDNDDVVLAHLNHKLVQMCLRLLRAEVWALEDTKKLHRIAFRTSRDVSCPTNFVFSRLIIVGGRHHRLHEELTLSGLEFKNGKLIRISTVGDREKIYESSNPLSKPSETDFNFIKQVVEDQEKAILAAVEARSKERLRDLIKTLELRKNDEIKDLNEVLDELTKTIQSKLKEDERDLESEQPLLPTMKEELERLEDQKRQLRKDKAALQARLAKIPREKEDEAKSIAARYKDPQERTFPVCIVVVLPENSKEDLR